jgi:hypothetical protein
MHHSLLLSLGQGWGPRGSILVEESLMLQVHNYVTFTILKTFKIQIFRIHTELAWDGTWVTYFFKWEYYCAARANNPLAWPPAQCKQGEQTFPKNCGTLFFQDLNSIYTSFRVSILPVAGNSLNCVVSLGHLHKYGVFDAFCKRLPISWTGVYFS